MTARLPTRAVGCVAAAAAIALWAGPSGGQPLPWEITVAEIEAGRIRQLAERLSKQNVLFQLHLGDTRKSDLVDTVAHIDRIIETLEEGATPYSIPSPWTLELREQVQRVDAAWGPLREIALARPYDYLQARRQFMAREDRGSDPLLLRYFDNLTREFVAESEKLIEAYDAECRATGIQLCETAVTSGYNAMLIERATKEAVLIVAGIDVKRNRKRLKATLESYEKQMKSNNSDPTFVAALSPERGAAGAAAKQMLIDLRGDWTELREEFTILGAGDEENFDLDRLLLTQARLIRKIERFTATLVRFANVTYGT